MRQGLLRLTFFVINPSQAVQEISVPGLDIQRLLQVTESFVEIFSLRSVNIPDEVVRVGMMRIDFQGVFHAGDGFVELPQPLEERTLLKVIRILFVIQFDGLVDIPVGFFIFIQRHVSQSQRMI